MQPLRGPGPHAIKLAESSEDARYQDAVAFHFQHLSEDEDVYWTVQLYVHTESGVRTLFNEFAVRSRKHYRVAAVARCPGAREWSAEIFLAPGQEQGPDPEGGGMSPTAQSALACQARLSSSEGEGPAIEFPTARHRSIVLIDESDVRLFQGQIVVGWTATSPDGAEVFLTLREDTAESEGMQFPIPVGGSVGSSVAFQGFPLRGPLHIGLQNGTGTLIIEVLDL